MNNQYDIRDISLAPSGHRKIQWVKHNMPLLSGLEEEFSATKPFEGLRISLSVHLEAKTAYLCLVLAGRRRTDVCNGQQQSFYPG